MLISVQLGEKDWRYLEGKTRHLVDEMPRPFATQRTGLRAPVLESDRGDLNPSSAIC